MGERRVVAGVLGVGLALPIVSATSAVARAVASRASATAAPSTSSLAAIVWIAGALVAGALFVAAMRASRRLPAALDGAARRRPIRATLWMLLALLSLAQLGRLGAFMADPVRTWGSTVPGEEVTRHSCMSAYVYAGELSRRGDPNVYDAAHWPAFESPVNDTRTAVVGITPYLDDPYEYPPPFLLLPRVALALTNDFLVIRAVWFALQAIAFILVALALAAWIGGRAGLVAGLLVPALVTSIPGMVNLQWGQAHLLTFLLCVGALLAFARGRAIGGGALLGAATVFKLFPGLVVVYLVVRRRWRDAGWTVAAAIALMLLALAVLGPRPFVEFVRYQLPRIGSGEAFSFFRRSAIAVSRNFAISGVVFKLDVLGLHGIGARAASAIGWIYTLVLLAVVVRVARRGGEDRSSQALTWLAMLALGSLRSPLAPGVYVSIGAMWLLTLFAARAQRARDVVVLVAAWLAITGGPPLPSVAADIALALAGQLAMVAVAAWALVAPGDPDGGVATSRRL